MNHMTQDDMNAPWNQVELPETELEVTVSLCLSKTVKIKTSDYELIDGDMPDFSDTDLKGEVENQIVLPHNLALYTKRMFDHDLNLKAAGMPLYLKEALNDCEGWNIDEFEVINE